jgi:hypothetical protein
LRLEAERLGEESIGDRYNRESREGLRIAQRAAGEFDALFSSTAHVECVALDDPVPDHQERVVVLLREHLGPVEVHERVGPQTFEVTDACPPIVGGGLLRWVAAGPGHGQGAFESAKLLVKLPVHPYA